MKYAEVVVNAPVEPREVSWGHRQGEEIYAERAPRSPSFHYSIPPHLHSEIALGQLVWVPFGRRRLQGVILAFRDDTPVEEVKDIYAIADSRPALTPPQLELARWISQYYLTRLIDAILLMLPPGMRHRADLVVEVGADVLHPAELTQRQRTMLEFLRRRGKMKLRRIGRELKMEGWRAVVKQLEQKGLVTKVPEPEELPAKSKLVRMVSPLGELTNEVLGSLSRAPRQSAILEHLFAEGPKPVPEILKEVGGSYQTVQALARRGLVAIKEQEVWRDPLASFAPEPSPPPKLTPAQATAWREIERGLASVRYQAFLLHGVTGSGKTEIYLRSLAAILARGEQAIVMVPEIALTPQTIQRFAARFPGRIAILHSRLSAGERYDSWRRIRDGLLDIVIGPRSAIFAPLPRLGLIVIDEEHEPSYKQEMMPRYNAREVAIRLAQVTKAKLILGSATPDIVSYYRAEHGEYELLELPQRIMGHRQKLQEQRARWGIEAARDVTKGLGETYQDIRYLDLPPVEVVDLRQELLAGNYSIFSRALQEAMREALDAREQIILFLNRRGAATFVICRECGYVPKCRRCTATLTFHSAEQSFVCHHCNRRYPVPKVCPQCMSKRIRYFGIGTQRVEAAVKELFPEARTLRWDLDVTGRKGAHEAIMRRFVEHQADVVIGTQMIAKGLDLPLVTLVGVISADTALHFPDFRASERTFQLLTQVAGRAGRSILGGKVIIQTYTPQHWCIQAASRHDYLGFYRQELLFRRQQLYPPFSHLVKLLYVHQSAKRCREEMERLHRELANKIERLGLTDTHLIGPAPAYFQRLRGRYRWQILLRAQNPHALLDGMALPLGWQIDVDPVSLL